VIVFEFSAPTGSGSALVQRFPLVARLPDVHIERRGLSAGGLSPGSSPRRCHVFRDGGKVGRFLSSPLEGSGGEGIISPGLLDRIGFIDIVRREFVL